MAARAPAKGCCPGSAPLDNSQHSHVETLLRDLRQFGATQPRRMSNRLLSGRQLGLEGAPQMLRPPLALDLTQHLGIAVHPFRDHEEQRLERRPHLQSDGR